MRKWLKYYIDYNVNGTIRLPMGRTFEQHASEMGQYESDDAYESKGRFLSRYFYGYHSLRLEYYDIFLRRHMKKGDDILSVASGRGANELVLMEDGYRIACSDLGIPHAYIGTKKLFSYFEYIELDILKTPSSKKYDAALSLSLIYLFNDNDLGIFFENIARSLKPGGYLILDSAGSPDSIPSFILNDLYLRFEASLHRWVKTLSTRRRPG